MLHIMIFYSPPQLSDMEMASQWCCSIEILKHVSCPYLMNSETLI